MEDDKKRYKGICPVCGAVLWICKSIAMQWGCHEEEKFEVEEFEKMDSYNIARNS